MQLPLELQKGIEELAEAIPRTLLKQALDSVSSEYRKGESSKKAFNDQNQLAAYLAVRMPATFAANVMVFRAIQERLPHFVPRSLLDLGAGPGTATWAALEMFSELSELHLVEREKEVIAIGKKLSCWGHGSWKEASLESSFPIPNVDLAVLSYVLAEMKMASCFSLLDRLADIPVVAIVEPGTPKGFERIRAFRDYAIKKGSQIVAPCPHQFACPMPDKDWCHFSARVERTRLHRQLKGTLGYEDEKFSYVVYAKPNFVLPPMEGRVVRLPKKETGFVRLPLCAKEGNLKEMTITRSSERYREARDAEWGSIW